MSSNLEGNQWDDFNLARFIDAQEGIIDQALEELRAGQKESHWMWFVFPQLDGLGTSSMARKYAIRSLEESRAYLKHPLLGPRLIECCRAILEVKDKSARQIMGSPDDLKLKSSMTLFSLAAPDISEFTSVLKIYYRGEKDQRTLDLLGR